MRMVAAGLVRLVQYVVAWALFLPLVLAGIVVAAIFCTLFVAALAAVGIVIFGLERLALVLKAEPAKAPPGATLHAFPGGKPAA